MMEYSALNAKIKAMRGKLLTASDYERLCHSPSVEYMARALSEYPAYQSAMSHTLNQEIHRDIVEQKILLSLPDDLVSIYHFINVFNIRKYMKAFFLNFDLNIIKLLLCMVYDERDICYSVPELNLLIGKELKIDSSKLKASKNTAEFIQNLQGTDFYGMLTKALTSHSSLFEIETQLDLYYYMNLWKQQRRFLDKANFIVMERINGTEIDLRNIMWVYRLKKYYNLNDARIYAYLIPIGYRLKRTELIRMIQCPTINELSAEIQNSPYGPVFGDLSNLERSYYRQMSRLYNNASIYHPKSLAYAAGFVFFKGLELRNLTSLLEGVRYKLKPKDIMSYLPIEAEA